MEKARIQGKTPLFLNIDETSVPLVYTHGKGNIMVLSGRRAWQMDLRQPIAHEQSRVNFTHLATICNIPAIQPKLPHIIYCSAPTLRVPDWHRICGTLPANVYLKRMPSAWNTGDQHRVFLRLLRAILEPYCDQYQPILSFDTASAHMRPEVLAELVTLGIWYVIIPPRMTWLLQPLDTHAFQKYKAYLKRGFSDGLAGRAGRVAIEFMIGLVCKAIRYVLQRFTWQEAFEKNGLTGDSTKVSSFIRKHLNMQELEPFPSECPTLDELKVLWPRSRRIPLVQVCDALVDADGYDAESEQE